MSRDATVPASRHHHHALALGVLTLSLVSAIEPDGAHAWTRTHLTGVSAHVQLLDAEQAHVAMSLRVRVSGGWISELELPGMPATAVPDPDRPPSLVADTGEKYRPTLVRRGDQWRVTFTDRRAAPWRGEYTLIWSYSDRLGTQASEGQTTTQTRWTMPPWTHDLENVSLWMTAPAGSQPADGQPASGAFHHSVMQLAGRTLIAYQRPQLPRHTPWPVAIVVPASQPAPQAAVTSPARTTKDALSASIAIWSPHLWLPIGILLLACLKRRATATRAREHSRTAVAWLPMPGGATRTTLLIALSTAASYLWDRHQAIAIACLAVLTVTAIDRRFQVRPGAATSWTAAPSAPLRRPTIERTRAQLSALRRIAPWMDATTTPGTATLLALLAALAWIGRAGSDSTAAALTAAVAVTALWTTATRLQLPWDGRTSAQRLQTWATKNAAALQAEGASVTATPLILVDTDGYPHDARLPINIPLACPGLYGADLVWITDGRTMRRNAALFAHVAPGSEADERLRAMPACARRAAGRTAAYAVAADQIFTALRALRSPDEHRTQAAAVSALVHAAA